MHISQAKELIRNMIQKEVYNVPILLVGSMGIGKSEIMSQLAKELGIEIVDLRLATQEPGDLIGLPVSVRIGGTDAHPIFETKNARPEWFPREGTKGILFFDELNRAPIDVRNAVFQILTEGRLHRHVLPKGWFIASAVNPDNGQYQVETLDRAMIRRFCTIPVSANAEGWLKWAHGSGVDESITSFIAAQPNLLQTQEDVSIEVHYTTAGWTKLSGMMKAKCIPQEIEIDVFTGLLGNTAAISYRKWLDSKYDRPASGDEVLNNYSKVQSKVKKQKNDENYSTIMDMVAVMENSKKPTKAQAENLKSFLKDVSNEFKTTLIKKLPKEWFAQVVDCEDLTDVVIKAMQEARGS